jgi:hypothetical protein
MKNFFVLKNELKKMFLYLSPVTERCAVFEIQKISESSSVVP